MKKWGIGILAAIMGLLIWYFAKPYDYRVTFKVRTLPGIVNQTIQVWSATLDSATVATGNSLGELTQQITFEDSLQQFSWKITPLTDSTSRVRVYASDPEHFLANRLQIPFADTDFEKRTRNTLLDFNSVLSEHLKEFRVRISGKAALKSTFCACTHVAGRQFDKARGMMQNYPLLGTILADNGVPLNGPPFIEIQEWDMLEGRIAYDFCYPIRRTEKLPEHPDILYRQFDGGPALKAIYNGNYITSDRAWYALMHHAESNNIQVTGLPVEIFLNNPNVGGDALQWTAEIYMPIIQAHE